MNNVSLRRNLPKLILVAIMFILTFSLSSCKFADQLSNFFGFNPMLNYLNLNKINIYMLTLDNSYPAMKDIVTFDFKEHDKDYYKDILIQENNKEDVTIIDTNEYDSQLSKYGIYFTNAIYQYRYLEHDNCYMDNQYFYIDISINNFKSTGVNLSCEGYESIIVTYTDNSLDCFTATNEEIDVWTLSDNKKVKNILMKCSFYNSKTSKIPPRLEHLEVN